MLGATCSDATVVHGTEEPVKRYDNACQSTRLQNLAEHMHLSGAAASTPAFVQAWMLTPCCASDCHQMRVLLPLHWHCSREQNQVGGLLLPIHVLPCASVLALPGEN